MKKDNHLLFCLFLLLSSFAFFFIYFADNYVSLLLKDKEDMKFSGNNFIPKSQNSANKVITEHPRG